MMDNQPVQQVPPVSPVPGLAVAGDKEERMWAMFCHLSALAGYLVPIPFAAVIGPLILWLIKRETYPLVNDQGKEAVNFQITMAIFTIVSVVLVLVLIGIAMLIGLAIFDLICVVIATIKANEGVRYRYPLCIRFIK